MEVSFVAAKETMELCGHYLWITSSVDQPRFSVVFALLEIYTVQFFLDLCFVPRNETVVLTAHFRKSPIV